MTLPEQSKLTLQHYRLENKQLKDELKEMQEVIVQKFLPIDNNLGDDFIKIMANAKSVTLS